MALTTEKQKQQIAEWRLLEGKSIEHSKENMAKKHGLERNAKFETAWRIAWDYGHSNGLSEVEIYFDELAELLKP